MLRARDPILSYKGLLQRYCGRSVCVCVPENITFWPANHNSQLAYLYLHGAVVITAHGNDHEVQ